MRRMTESHEISPAFPACRIDNILADRRGGRSLPHELYVDDSVFAADMERISGANDCLPRRLRRFAMPAILLPCKLARIRLCLYVAKTARCAVFTMFAATAVPKFYAKSGAMCGVN